MGMQRTSPLATAVSSRSRPARRPDRPPSPRSPHFYSPPFEGGCEGLAMLNRTNRTLSANLNRLNLGTRSLAAPANVNTGDLQTLRIGHARHVVMRDGMHGLSSFPIPIRRG